MLGQFVTEGHRLRVLEVREPGAVRVDMQDGLIQECLLQIRDGQGDRSGPIPQVQTEVRRHLVVAAAPRTKPSPEIAEALDEVALDRRVDVLVGGVGKHTTGRDVRSEAIECNDDGRELLFRQQPGTLEHRSMGASLRDVVRRKPPVEVRRQAQCCHGIRGTLRESAAPQARRLGIGHGALLWSAMRRSEAQSA